MRWKSKGKPPGKGLECQHEELDCGWQAVGNHGAFLSRREAGPTGGWWLGMGQTMEGKLVFPGACAPGFLSFCLKQEARRGSQVPTSCIPELAGPHHSQRWNLGSILKREAWEAAWWKLRRNSQLPWLPLARGDLQRCGPASQEKPIFPHHTADFDNSYKF